MDISTLPKLSIRGTIAPKELAFFDEEVFCADDAAKFLVQHKLDPTIVLEVDSPGGYVQEGKRIYNLLVASGKEIISVGFRVNSIAVFPFLAGKKRYVTSNCEFWIHNARIDPNLLGVDALTANDLKELAESVESTDEEILDFYSGVIGTKNLSKIAKLMNEEHNLGSAGAIKYGFAHDIWEGEPKDIKLFKVKNFVIEEFLINKITNKQNMDTNEELKKQSGILEGLLNSFKKLVKTRVKNEVALISGDKTIVVLTEDEVLVGKKAVFADADGLPTDEVVPAGEHPLEDGRTLVVGDGGMVSEVKEAVDAEALKTEIANLKKNVVDVTKERDTVKKELDDFKKTTNLKLTQIETAFENFKKEIPGDPDDDKTQDLKKKIENRRKEGKKLSKREILQEMSREKFQNKK